MASSQMIKLVKISSLTYEVFGSEQCINPFTPGFIQSKILQKIYAKNYKKYPRVFQCHDHQPLFWIVIKIVFLTYQNFMLVMQIFQILQHFIFRITVAYLQIMYLRSFFQILQLESYLLEVQAIFYIYWKYRLYSYIQTKQFLN